MLSMSRCDLARLRTRSANCSFVFCFGGLLGHSYLQSVLLNDAAPSCPHSRHPQETSTTLFLEIAGATRATQLCESGFCANKKGLSEKLTRSFDPCAVIILVCRFIGLLFKAVKLPSVIGEIIAGEASIHRWFTTGFSCRLLTVRQRASLFSSNST